MKQSKFEYSKADGTGYYNPVRYSRHETKRNYIPLVLFVLFALVSYAYFTVPTFQAIVNSILH